MRSASAAGSVTGTVTRDDAPGIPVPTTEERLRAVTIGPLDRGDIVLVEYDSAWPARFEQEAARIRNTLGAAALVVEHVGSTSVPGLTAKPIIDIVLVVESSADEPSYVPALEAAGYVLRIREPDWLEHRMLKSPGKDVNLHVFSAGCPEIDRMLVFRDRLRTSDADRQLYAAAKRELAARRWKHVQYYADAKTSIVEEILARASGAAR